MSCTIVTTPGATDATSYSDIAAADAYFDAHPYPTTWQDAGEDEKCRALVLATRMLDSWFDWFGIITHLDQALLWPRTGVLRPGVALGIEGGVGGPWHEPFGVLLDAHTIPVRIREAAIELANSLLVSDRTADSDVETQRLRSLTAGPVSLTFGGGVVAKPIPDWVMSMVSSLGRPRSRTGSGAVLMQRG